MYGGCLDSETAMKDVAICEKLRGGDEQPLIRRCPNGETLSLFRENLERVFKKQT